MQTLDKFVETPIALPLCSADAAVKKTRHCCTSTNATTNVQRNAPSVTRSAHSGARYANIPAAEARPNIRVFPRIARRYANSRRGGGAKGRSATRPNQTESVAREKEKREREREGEKRFPEAFSGR